MKPVDPNELDPIGPPSGKDQWWAALYSKEATKIELDLILHDGGREYFDEEYFLDIDDAAVSAMKTLLFDFDDAINPLKFTHQPGEQTEAKFRIHAALETDVALEKAVKPQPPEDQTYQEHTRTPMDQAIREVFQRQVAQWKVELVGENYPQDRVWVKEKADEKVAILVEDLQKIFSPFKKYEDLFIDYKEKEAEALVNRNKLENLHEEYKSQSPPGEGKTHPLTGRQVPAGTQVSPGNPPLRF